MRLYLGAALLKADRPSKRNSSTAKTSKNSETTAPSSAPPKAYIPGESPPLAQKVEQDFQRAWKNADVTLKASVF